MQERGLRENMIQSDSQLKSGTAGGEVSVKLFAGVAELAGVKELRVSVKNLTVAEVRCALEVKLPQLIPLLSRSAIAVDGRYATEDELLCSDSEIAIIPPVSGG
jgi:molybdopterin converting factor small subunit|tara:strand:+ start:477 stop:788 length:312 start_codon:yes stop_codon:yes gene_type:complete